MILVTFGSAAVVGVELVVDAAGTGDLIAMHIGPACLPLYVSTLEAGDAAEQRWYQVAAADP
jgi:hypothetical protein